METKNILPSATAIAAKLSIVDNYLLSKEKMKNASKLHTIEPFSQRLNIFVETWFEENKAMFTMTEHDEFDDSDYKTAFANMKNRFDETGKIQVVKTNFPTIFGDSEVYDKFRAWHDYLHVMCNCGFDVGSESIVASVQSSKLPEEWLFEKELIIAQIAGTNQYYKIHKDYVKDHREFISMYITDPEKAIFTEQIDKTL
jgi:hypothetical protein